MVGKRLQVLIQMADAIAAEFGTDCEVVIHDLSSKSIDKSVVYIKNGHISGRSIGDGPSEVVIEAIKSKKTHQINDKLSYLTRTDSGRVLKSSTVFVKDDDDEIKYILGINYDITNLLALNNSIGNLINNEDTSYDDAKTITHDVNTLLDDLLAQSVALIGLPVSLMSKEDKIKAINFLNDAGAFLITKSGDKVSKFFGISKYTLYSYVNINK